MKIKRLLTWVMTAVFVFCTPVKALSVRADSPMTAQAQVQAMNVGWNLGNTLDSYGTWLNSVTPDSVETCWGNPLTTRQMIAAVRERGFNTIRIPVTWAQFTDDQGNVDEAWMSRVRQVVDWAIDEGLYVILNVHHDTGEHGSDKVCWVIADEGTYDSVADRFEGLWTNIANEFKDYDNRLMFEGYNEMLDMNNSWNAPTTGNGAFEAVNSFAQLFVDTVRATGGNNATRNLIVNTYVASVDQSVLDNFVLPQDTVSDHLIVEVHSYTPYQFCSVAGDSSYTSFDSNCRSAVDSTMSAIAAFSSSHNVPVIIGEFGVENKNNDSDRQAYAAYYIQQATQNGIRCIWWDNGISDYGGYAILDRNSLSWNEGITSALIDNAPSGQAAAAEDTSAQPIETSASSPETSSSQEQDSSQTSSEQASETSAQASSVSTAAPAADEFSQNINENHSGHTIILVIGAVAVVAAYVGLFFLGRKNGKK